MFGKKDDEERFESCILSFFLRTWLLLSLKTDDFMIPQTFLLLFSTGIIFISGVGNACIKGETSN